MPEIPTYPDEVDDQRHAPDLTLQQLMIRAMRLAATKPDRLCTVQPVLTIREVYQATREIELPRAPPEIRWYALRRGGDPLSNGFHGATPEEALKLLCAELEKEVTEYLTMLEEGTRNSLEAITKAKAAIASGAELPPGILA